MSDLERGVVLDEEGVVLLRVLLPDRALVEDGRDLVAVRQRVRQALEGLRDQDARRAPVRVGVVQQTQQIVYQLRLQGLVKLSKRHSHLTEEPVDYYGVEIPA